VIGEETDLYFEIRRLERSGIYILRQGAREKRCFYVEILG
jgi:hypothetical protein